MKLMSSEFKIKRILLSTILLSLIVLAGSAKSKGVYCFFETEKSVYEDSNIKVTIVFQGSIVDLEVYNKTNNVIYLDKGSSFAYKNKEPICLFQNSSETIIRSKSGGATVNLGNVTDAMGIGGAAGTIADGVRISGGSSSSKSITYYEQKILSLAPQATYSIFRWGISKDDIIYQIDKKREEGSIFTFKEVYSPCVLKAIITYSSTRDFQITEQISVDSYVSTMVVDSKDGLYGLDLNKTKYCDPYRKLPFYSYKL